MKPIEKSELYEHVSQFLKGKGVEMKDGAYAKHLEKSCGLLTDAINLTQKGMERAKTELDKRLEQMRQVIHEKTAPKSARPSSPTAAAASTAAPPKTTAQTKRGNSQAGRKPQPRKPKRSRNSKGKS